ncbi:hypothetical protein ACFL6C_03055 [Myxococcota bacterium]
MNPLIFAAMSVVASPEGDLRAHVDLEIGLEAPKPRACVLLPYSPCASPPGGPGFQISVALVYQLGLVDLGVRLATGYGPVIPIADEFDVPGGHFTPQVVAALATPIYIEVGLGPLLIWEHPYRETRTDWRWTWHTAAGYAFLPDWHVVASFEFFLDDSPFGEFEGTFFGAGIRWSFLEL